MRSLFPHRGLNAFQELSPPPRRASARLRARGVDRDRLLERGSPSPSAVRLDVERYDLKGDYDWARGRLVATVDITLVPEGTTRDNHAQQRRDRGEVRAALEGDALPFTTDATEKHLRVDISSLPERPSGTAITLEIAYEAEPGDGLFAVFDRKGDPLKDVRALFTHSEPFGAQRWMPCHDAPSDRALFSVEMGMSSAETMIANSVVTDDKPGKDGGHRMKYETAYALPTYLMAFAISDFEVESTTKGSVPISIWHRRGLPGEYASVLNELVGVMAHFEELLGPYPFERYALVHLPMLPATGMENAGITFQYEYAGSTAMGAELSVTAHELGHQWYGDLVTIEDWDDMWIKEGMASLLEVEGLRAHSDKDGPLTLNGDNYWPTAGEAIRDTSLAPPYKYTTGPYSRAAWLLTQIRSLVGEEAFWKILRGVLEQHRFGSIGTEEFLDAFAEALGPEATARARRAVDAKLIPTLEMKLAPSGNATMTVRDEEDTLIAPLDVAWVADDGSVRTETLAANKPLEIAPKQSGEVLRLDPLDRHPPLESLIMDEESMNILQANITPLLSPTTPAGLANFLDSGSANQEVVLWSSLPGVPPEGSRRSSPISTPSGLRPWRSRRPARWPATRRSISRRRRPGRASSRTSS